MDKTYSITELSREFKISTRSIRYYEDVGLVCPTRKGSSRIYSRRDRIRLMLTLRGKRLGFSLAECLELIDLYDTTASNKDRQLKAVIEKVNQKRSELQQQLDDIRAIEEGLDNLEAMCNAALKKNESRKKNHSANQIKNQAKIRTKILNTQDKIPEVSK
jgi:DNA-binding transcriptional MerR regulator